MAVDASPGAGRVLFATSGGPLTAEPSWARKDNLGSTCRCYGFDYDRGRQSEFDVTNTGTARIYFHDMAGTFADEDWIGFQVMLQLYDPVTAAWQPVFRGHIDDIHNEPHPNAPTLTNVQIDCVDLFDYLGSVKMVVGTMGDTLTTQDGIVFYEDENVDDRLVKLATDAGLAADMGVFFTGNISVLESQYDTDDDILSAMREAADAEFPSGVAQVYVDRYGRVVFHGRFARFDPDTVSSGAEWDFTRWEAATREDVTSGRAQIREFKYNAPRTRIINSYVAWPMLNEDMTEFDQADIPTMVKTDATSIAAYGYRGQEAASLIIKENINNANTGRDECELFGEYFVSNYNVPHKNIERITFKTLDPDDPLSRDTAGWALMTRVDVSDFVHLYIDEAGLSGDEFIVEGVSGECRVGPPEYDMVTVTLNLSPAAYYLDDVFNP
jgi:hypothetical protein